MFTTVKQSKRTDMILTKGVIDRYRLARKKLIWHSWRDWMRERQMQRRKIITLMRFYRKHKVRDLFNRYKKITFTTPKPVKLLGFSEKEAHEILH